MKVPIPGTRLVLEAEGDDAKVRQWLEACANGLAGPAQAIETQLKAGTVGVEGQRDPDYPCHAFRSGKPAGSCESDGHYMCAECVELDPESEAAERHGVGRRP